MNGARGLVWLVLSATLAACAPPEPSAPPPVELDAYARGRVDLIGGTLRLAAQREGIIAEVFVEEGDAVAQGQVLAVIDTKQAALRVAETEAMLREREALAAAADARLAGAEREERRLQGLAASDAIARSELDRQADAVAVARAEAEAARRAIEVATRSVDLAAYEIEARTIRAPVAGRIVRRSAKPGDGASTLNVTELFILAPTSPKIVRAEIDETFVDQVQPGMRAEVISEIDESKRYPARVLRLGETFIQKRNADDPNERSDLRVIEIILIFDEQPPLRLGQRVLVRIDS